MRALVLSLALVLAAPVAAVAQEPGASAATTPAANPTRAAVRDVYQSLFFDTGLFDQLVIHFNDPWRDAIQQSDYYRTATPAHRQALDALPQAMADIVRQDILMEADVMANNVSPAAASILSPEEIQGFANFFRDPQWHDFVQRIIAQSIDEKKGEQSETPITAEEQRRMAEFERTPVGRALTRSGTPFLALLRTELDAALVRMTPRIRIQVITLVCNALGDQCTEDMRQAARQT